MVVMLHYPPFGFGVGNASGSGFWISFFLVIEFQGFPVVVNSPALIGTKFLLAVCRPVGVTTHGTGALPVVASSSLGFSIRLLLLLSCLIPAFP